ncbi:CheY-like chemotaxis protein [Azospirillum agricola]|uniref:response regulator n=1 Tax=Azospirillum agricola TaxID=1720247 RepID=UPI001F17C8D4|nr:response regulator [Azospirillum agricola]MBP2230734.1 CheY-like chemotaxis protein [Azospirillum agricola]
MQANAATALPSLRILLAEDEVVNRMAATALLRRAGHAVVVVEDGPAALSAATDGTVFDLVLMDLRLPGLDGDEVVRQLRARPAAAAAAPPRILMLTASAAPDGLERCRSCGADGVLTKPLRLDALEAALRDGTADSPAPQAGGGAFDESAIGQMRDLLPADRVALLIGRTAATLRDYRVSLDAAWATGDRAAASMMAHKLAGVSGQYGCVALRRAAQALEAAVERGDDPAALDAALRTLDSAYGPALAYLDAQAGR